MDALKRLLWRVVDKLGHANWSLPTGYDYVGLERSYCRHGADLATSCITCRGERDAAR